MPTELLEPQTRPQPRLHIPRGALFLLAAGVFVLAVAVQILLQTLELCALEIAPLPLLAPGERCGVSLTVDYTFPAGLPQAVESGLLALRRCALRPVYTVADPDIAAVTADGEVTALGEGVTALTVTVGGLTDTVELVVGGTPAAELQLLVYSDRIRVGTTITPGLQVLPADADYYTDIELYSSDENILRENEDGSFTAIAPGVVTLCARTFSAQLVETEQTIYVTP